MKKIGITERGDAGLHFEWTAKMDIVEFAIIITKNPNDRFLKELLTFKDKVILHATCTGFAGSILEPNVPKVSFVYNQLNKLINLNFPKEQIVLRIDPIIPTPKGIARVDQLLEYFEPLHVSRVRFSFLDFYPHVKRRFKNADVPIPYDYLPTTEMYKNFQKLIDKWSNIYLFESCAENIGTRKGCISDIDAITLHKSTDILKGSANQRANCLCPANKFEMLSHKGQCPHKCLYCYWY